jgi:hypothetical protein
MPVLSNEDDKVIGKITISDLVKLYDNEVQKISNVINRSNIEVKNNDISNINQIKNKSTDPDE